MLITWRARVVPVETGCAERLLRDDWLKQLTVSTTRVDA